jgi:hypothetical protein
MIGNNPLDYIASHSSHCQENLKSHKTLYGSKVKSYLNNFGTVLISLRMFIYNQQNSGLVLYITQNINCSH